MSDPGKYDELCTLARVSAEAAGAALIIINGKHGGGFSVQMPPEFLMRLPGILEFMAAEIRKDLPRQMKMAQEQAESSYAVSQQSKSSTATAYFNDPYSTFPTSTSDPDPAPTSSPSSDTFSGGGGESGGGGASSDY